MKSLSFVLVVATTSYQVASLEFATFPGTGTYFNNKTKNVIAVTE